MSLVIADAFVALRGDFEQLLADAARGGSQAGDNAGKSFGASLKKAAGAAIGAGIGYAVGATLSGANDLDAASRRLFADTGLVGAEAQAAEHALADMYRNNIQGFGEIGATMAVVRTQLHLTGDEADALTERILKYATATGQAAPDAATGLTAVLKAFNLTATDSNAVMDALILSHQKFGGSLTDEQAALASMGPALVAANMNWGQGIALLNMFTAAGVDSAAVTVAMAHALTKVKSPEELQKLIADISATQDPFLRAQKAADLFGAKAGPKMAAALAEGSAGLDQFAVSTTGTGAATNQAAKDIESGFGENFRLIMKGAEGQLAEFGTSFGDIIGIAQLFGPQFTKALLAGLGGLAGLTVVQGAIKEAAGGAETLYLRALFAGDALSGAAAAAWAKVAGSQAMLTAAGLAGGKAGTAFSIGASAAIVAMPVVVTYLMVQGNNEDRKRQQDQVSAEVQSVIATGSLDGMQKALAQMQAQLKIEQNLDSGPSGFIRGLFGGKSVTPQVLSDIDALTAAIGTAATTGVRYALIGGTPGVKAAAGDVGDAITVPIGASVLGVELSARDFLTWTIANFKAKYGELVSIGNDTADAIYGPATRAAGLAANARDQQAQLEIINGKNLTAAQKHQLDIRIVNAEHHLAELKKMHASADAIASAQEALAALRSQRNSKATTDAEKRDARDRLLALQKEGLGIRIEMAGRGELSKAAYNALIADLTKASTHGSAEVRAAAAEALHELAMLKAAAAAIPAPPWWRGGRPTPTAAGGYREAGELLLVGERGPELWMPQTAGVMVPNYALAASTFAPAAMASSGEAAGGGGRNTFNITVQPGRDTSLQAAQRFGQGVADAVASILREQTARSVGFR